MAESNGVRIDDGDLPQLIKETVRNGKDPDGEPIGSTRRFAELCLVTHTTILNICNKPGHRPQRHTLTKIARFWGISADELLEWCRQRRRERLGVKWPIKVTMNLSRTVITRIALILVAVPLFVFISLEYTTIGIVGWFSDTDADPLPEDSSAYDLDYVEDMEARKPSDTTLRVLLKHDRSCVFTAPTSNEVTSAYIDFPNVVWATRDRLTGEPSKIHIANLKVGKMNWEASLSKAGFEEFYGKDRLKQDDLWIPKLQFAHIEPGEKPEVVAVLWHGRFAVCAARLYSIPRRSPIDWLLSKPSKLDLDREFLHWGFLYDFTVSDVDRDHALDVVLWGTSNTQNGGTFVVLDRYHWNGGAEDSFLGAKLSEGSKRRLALPPYPKALLDTMRTDKELKRVRAHAFKILRSADGSAFAFDVGEPSLSKKQNCCRDANLRFQFDLQLSLVARSWDDSSDALVHGLYTMGRVPFDLTSDPGFKEWMTGAYRFSCECDHCSQASQA